MADHGKFHERGWSPSQLRLDSARESHQPPAVRQTPGEDLHQCGWDVTTMFLLLLMMMMMMMMMRMRMFYSAKCQFSLIVYWLGDLLSSYTMIRSDSALRWSTCWIATPWIRAMCASSLDVWKPEVGHKIVMLDEFRIETYYIES